jgi:hypothetical protein
LELVQKQELEFIFLKKQTKNQVLTSILKCGTETGARAEILKKKKEIEKQRLKPWAKQRLTSS